MIGEAYFIYQDDNGIVLYELINGNLNFPLNFLDSPRKYQKVIMEADAGNINFENRLITLPGLYNSIFYNHKIAQKEMMLNLKHQGYM